MKTKISFCLNLISGGLILALSACTALQSFQAVIAWGSRLPIGPVVVIDGEDNTDPDLLILNRDIADSDDELSTDYFSMTTVKGGQRTLKWEYNLNIDNHLEQALIDETNVYISRDVKLLALDRADGTLRWETELSDSIPYHCQPCIQKVGGRLIVLTQDRMLHGVDPQNGEVAWQVRLNAGSAPSSAIFYGVKDRIVLLDYDSPSSTTTALFVYEAATGKPVRTLYPDCGGDYRIGMNTLLEVDPYNEQLYLIFGGYGGQMCAQAWDVTRQAPLWSSPFPAEFSFSESDLLMTPQRLYMNTPPVAVDLESGKVTVFPEIQDYELRLISVQSDQELALARRTRGSSRYEIWKLDAVGEVLWKHELQVGDEKEVEAQLLDEGVIVLQLLKSTDTDFDELLFERLDVKQGTVTTQTRTRLNGYWSGTIWTTQAAYVTMRNVDRIDLETGKVTGAWPLPQP